MESTDKDFRFMATNDLMSELQKETIQLDEDTERKVVRMLLKLLEDKNGEVQNKAVKCLGPLVNKVKDNHVELVVETLTQNMTRSTTGAEQLRDISSMGLKTVIGEIPATSCNLISIISKKIIGKLTDSVKQQSDVTVQLEALDILSDLLNRFGNILLPFHPSILEALLAQLSSDRLAVRKRSITAISFLTVSCDSQTLDCTINSLIRDLSRYQDAKSVMTDIGSVRTRIQCLASISRSSGHRFGGYLASLYSLVQLFAKVNDDELREYCIQTLEAFARKCPKEMGQYIQDVIQLTLKYLSYDPNYNYDDDDTEDDDMEMDNEDDNDSNDEYSDDDDMSWKVRRASAKCLEAIIVTRHDLIVELYQTVSPQLISRFKEREENVKVDVFQAYIALLKQTRSSTASALDHSCGITSSDMNGGINSPIGLLSVQVKDIVRSLHKLLREKSVKTRQGAFLLLTELIQVLPSSLRDDAATLIPGILYSMNDKNSSSNMKIDALSFLNSFMKTTPPEVFQPHTQSLLPAVIASVGDPFYKISSEALLVLTQMIRVIRPLPGQTDSAFAFDSYVKPIYDCTLSKLSSTDIDQEVKERAITCMGQVVSTFGDRLSQELTTCLMVMLDRLKNEITRLTCVKALFKIACSPFRLDVSPLLPQAFPILASFLRKNHRALKLDTLTLLDALCRNYGSYLNNESISVILTEAPPLINENDLHVSQLTLALLTSLIRTHSEMQDLAIIPQRILPEALLLVRSPLLQGTALQSVIDFFQALVTSSFPGLNYQQLVLQLTAPLSTSPNASPNILHKQAYVSIAKCVSAITVLDAELSVNVIRGYLNEVLSNNLGDAKLILVFLVIGEIGKVIDTSSVPNLKNVIVQAFSSPCDEVKTAASFALGSIAVGNLREYLPFVLREIESNGQRQYLLLHSLKEIINCQSVNPIMIQLLAPHLESVWIMLMNHCECPEEGTRNVVAECLGKLTVTNPGALLPRLKEQVKNRSPLTRATVVTAMKFTISDQPQAIDTFLKGCIADFLSAITDEDPAVRRVALVSFNSAAHNKPSLIRDLLPTLLPLLYNETVPRQELIREVEMGPFKHRVDDGLDIRKAAFECMYTLLDSCLDQIEVFDFLTRVEEGLKDHYDIKMLIYLMLVRLASLCPSAVLARMDRIIEALKTTCLSKVKANAVKQEFEKQDELKRSALRAFLSLMAIPAADKSPVVISFYDTIIKTQELSLLFDQIRRDTQQNSCSADLVISSMDTN